MKEKAERTCDDVLCEEWNYQWRITRLSFCVVNIIIQVPNFIPSISSCIGNATPQRYIWRASIALMLTVRLYSGLLYYGWFQVI